MIDFVWYSLGLINQVPSNYHGQYYKFYIYALERHDGYWWENG